MLTEYTLETKLKEWSGPYSTQHSQGWNILLKFYDTRDHRVHIIVERSPNNYAVGIGYDVTTGSWGQGWYDYKNISDAIYDLKEKYHVIEVK